MDNQNQESAKVWSDSSIEASRASEILENSCEMETLGEFFERCIQQVSCLEKQRDELIQEVIALQEPMLQVVQQLREKLEENHRLLTLTQLDYIAVYEQVQRVKKKLFVVVRECIQSQTKLAEQKYDVAESALTQEELQAHLQSLTEDLTQVRVSHQNELNSLRDRASKTCRPRATSDVSQCREASIRLQRRLSGSMKTLESWYEPRLLALLRRRQIGEETLRNWREQAGDLRARLRPLREDIQKLELQRSNLEKKIDLMKNEREESFAHYKETVEQLTETSRELETEFEVQRKSKKDLETLKECLVAELIFLRGPDESSRNTKECGSNLNTYNQGCT